MLGSKCVFFCLLAVALAGPPVFQSREDIEEYKKVLEKSMEDDGLLLEDRMTAYPEANVWENSGRYQGDIVLDKEQIEHMVTSYASGGRMAYTRPNTRWPQNTVVYEFGANEFNAAQQRHILANMNWIENQSCVRFRLRNANDRHWVRITGRPSGCFASVGFHSGRQISTFNVARANPGQGCLNSVVIIHEWYHVLGFFHMQSTHNRYTYVRIHWNNIEAGKAHNFQRYESNLVSNLNAPYEYGSCMHYGTHFFSKNRQPTLSTTRTYNGVLGQTVRITGWDVLRLRRHYNCPGAWSAMAMEDARVSAYEPNEEGEFELKENPYPVSEMEMDDAEEDLE